MQEFWYTNTLDRWRDYFPGSPMPGKGPLREVRVRVDGQLGTQCCSIDNQSIR